MMTITPPSQHMHVSQLRHYYTQLCHFPISMSRVAKATTAVSVNLYKSFPAKFRVRIWGGQRGVMSLMVMVNVIRRKTLAERVWL